MPIRPAAKYQYQLSRSICWVATRNPSIARTDVTMYTFFSPFAHPAAITKIYYMLNADDRAKAYHEMFEGKSAEQPAAGYSDSIKKLAQEHLDLARSVGVSGTPTFFISGKQVVGADFQKIEKLLSDASHTDK